MKFLIFGTGALGSLLAARLAQDNDVTIIGRAEHIKAIRKHGLRVTGKTELCQTKLRTMTNIEDSPIPDAILVTVKAYDTHRAVASLARFYHSSSFISLQNGLGNEEVMARHAKKVLGAVINQGVTLLGPGEIFHAGTGSTEFGLYSGTTIEDVAPIVSSFKKAGMPASIVDDIRTHIWLKAVLNAAVNPLTALLRIKTGKLLDGGPLETAIRSIVLESVAIAKSSDTHLDEEEVLKIIRRVIEATQANKSSMLQDLEKGRRTEIDAINGAIVEIARANDVPHPVNALLTNLIRAAETNSSSIST